MRVEVILVCTGKYADEEDWWVENIRHMLENVNLFYDKINVIRDEVYGGVYDKLRMFELYKDRNTQYIYFDLDLVISGSIHHLLRKELTVLHAWWRDKLHTPLNSSIVSWQGDYSYIHDLFAEDPEYYMLKYNKGIDEYLYKEYFKIEKYEPVCCSFPYGGFNTIWPVCLFNQNADMMRKSGAWKFYTKN